ALPQWHTSADHHGRAVRLRRAVRLELAGGVRRADDQCCSGAARVLPDAAPDHQGLRRRAEGMTDMQAYALRTDGQDEPQGVVTAPTFSWRLRSEHRGARQTSYRLLVHLHTPAGQHVQVWDSGEVAGSTTVGVRYQGAPLQTSADYSWHLEVSDEAGRRTTASSRFATGIVHPCEWQGLWIGRNPDEQKSALPPQDTDISYTVNKLRPVRRFVRHLDLEDVPARAKVHASAKGNYRLYINGHKVGTDELTPGWTEYRDRICYQSWDVTQLLRPGRNSIAALLPDGWYVGFIGTDRRHQAQHYGEEPELLVQLVSDAANGERTVIGTDSQWQQQPSDILYADQLMGQYEDSRQANPDWHLPATDVTGWSYAVVTDQDHTRLVPESDPGVRVTGRLPARRVLRRSPDRHIVDFGQNLVGRVRLVIRGQAEGTRVQLTHAEVLDADGELYTENLRTAEPVDVFWTDGSPEQVFEPRFTFHGFRYVQISGLNGELTAADIEAVVLHNGFDMVGEFSSSSADLDQLFSNISWGLRGNFLSIPTDCPQRDERLGWLADAQVFAPTALALADV